MPAIKNRIDRLEEKTNLKAVPQRVVMLFEHVGRPWTANHKSQVFMREDGESKDGFMARVQAGLDWEYGPMECFWICIAPLSRDCGQEKGQEHANH